MTSSSYHGQFKSLAGEYIDPWVCLECGTMVDGGQKGVHQIWHETSFEREFNWMMAKMEEEG